MFELTGTVKKIFEEQTFASGFNKREFVLTVPDGRFPQEIKFECLKDKVSLLDKVAEGQELTVSFDIRGREWNGNYFVNLAAWKLSEGGGKSGSDADSAVDAAADSGAFNEPDLGDDDVPF